MESNNTLYALSQALRTAIEGGYCIDDDTGEILWEPDDIEKLNLRIQEKAEGVLAVSREYTAMADAVDAEIKRLTALKKAYQQKTASLERYLMVCLEVNGGAIDTPIGRISTRKSSHVEIVDESEIPDDFIKEKVTRTVDKAGIKAAMKLGTYIPGAVIVNTANLSIR